LAKSQVGLLAVPKPKSFLRRRAFIGDLHALNSSWSPAATRSARSEPWSRVLCEDGHAGAEFVLTGPQSLSKAEQVSHTIGLVIGRSLHIEEISPEEARRELLTLGPLVAVNMLRLGCLQID